ncbi:putative glycosyl transferase [Clostridium neonatale]|uniref:glycosyltransferase family 2 protein n=1 Tax=Clostridium neonatale TaxID=137838 RepID=UPI00291B78DD|nr:putative glycosyl transferase [Clostridium neonatale]CAI3624374.1 putative glycosyl transferase [Clostridium neonatale]CAI3630462.1 putative glycosyl transferase [Clostridium neonatale]CAI3659369.1 putative glycosyl transferase [Clostridium neonatale]CAI3671424.1 putative glycosyl transferase [Clostridium neonatale]
MGKYIFTITTFFQLFVFGLTCYYLILGLFGFFRNKEKKNYDPKNKFALIIAAHNEEVVIGNLIESMLKLDYPKEMYDIFVIADNCTDNTAKIARGYNVNVCERNVSDKRGKGYALEWMFDKLFKMEEQYDAIAIFDADNLVHKNFLKEINSKMLQGYKVVQGYIDSKNPNDSWIAAAYSIAFWTQNRMFQLARANVGFSNQIGGTGFAIETDTLRELGWGATCLTEDLEFTCKLVLNGEKVGWAHDAIIYDEKPLKLAQSWSQRKRWMQGFTDVASRYFFKLLKKSIVERKFYMFDCALYVLQPFITLLLGVSALLTILQANTKGLNIFIMSYLFSDIGWKAFAAVQFLLTPLVLAFDKKVSKGFLAMMFLYSTNVFIVPYLSKTIGDIHLLFIGGITLLYNLAFLILTWVFLGKKNLILFFRFLLYGLYTLTWIPITIQGILNKNNKEWSHTKHVRKIEICDV